MDSFTIAKLFNLDIYPRAITVLNVIIRLTLKLDEMVLYVQMKLVCVL